MSTCDLFAALEIATGRVITDIRPRHTSADFVAFLNKVNREVPRDLDVHVILDNLATHKTPTVHKWLLRHRRFHFHITPTYGSWMNVVERWFSALTTKKLQRSANDNFKALAADIQAWADQWNEHPPRSCGTRPPNRSLNVSPATAPPSNKTPQHDTHTFTALQPSRTLGPQNAQHRRIR
jgi:transposase